MPLGEPHLFEECRRIRWRRAETASLLDRSARSCTPRAERRFSVHSYSSLMDGDVGGERAQSRASCVLLRVVSAAGQGSAFCFPFVSAPSRSQRRAVKSSRPRRPGRGHQFVSLSCHGGREFIRGCPQGSLHAGAHRWRMRRHCCRCGSIPARHSAHKNAGASARAHGQLELARTQLIPPRTLHRRRRKAS